jgi:DNA polymerase-1
MFDTVLIDGDITAYQVCSAAEQEWDWGGDVWTLWSDRAEVRVKFHEAISEIIEKTEAAKCVIAFTDSRNFRKDVLESYKGNRAGVRKPMHLAYLREWAKEHWKVVVKPSLEGDDVLGILATMNPKSSFIYSADKDMKTLPCALWSQDDRIVYHNNELVADWWFMLQTLTGDTTDNYKGCPGIGPKKAQDILGEPGMAPIEDLWPRVVKAYEKAGLTEDDALVQARCARILRHTDYSPEEGAVKLWTPPRSK